MKNMKKRMRVMGKALRMELREHKSSFIVYMTLRALVILVMILQILNRNFENVFLCALTLVLLIMPSLIQINLKIELPTALEIIMLLFIFAAEILGEIQAYYEKIPMWDTVLHTLNGFLMAAIGFALVDILNRNKKISFQLSPAFLAVVAFCFSMTIGVIWEFFEFGMDQIFHLDMQKDTIVNTIYSVMLDPAGGNHVVGVTGIRDVAVNGEALGLGGYLDIGLIDTMKDLFVTFIGATVFSIIGFIYLLARKVIRPYITLSILVTVAVFSGIFWLIDPSQYTDPLFNLLTGGVLLGSVFMATDYVTSPMSDKGGIIFGVGIGIITMLIRYFGSYPEGMSFAILIMNSTVPLINKFCKQKKFGRA